MGCQKTNCIKCGGVYKACQLTNGVCQTCIAKEAAAKQAQNVNTTNPPQG